MGGSSSKTITDVQVVGLNENVGTLRKALVLEAGKQINNGISVVGAAYGQQISQLKSLYNDGYLTTLGYNPTESIKLSKLDKETILDYTINNIDSEADVVSNLNRTSLTVEVRALLALQDYPNYNNLDRSFTLNDTKFNYMSSVQNNEFIDITTFKNPEETIPDYLSSNYDDYEINYYESSVTVLDGIHGFSTSINYTTIETVTNEDGTTSEVSTVHEDVLVHVPVYIEYIQIPDDTYNMLATELNTFTKTYENLSGCYSYWVDSSEDERAHTETSCQGPITVDCVVTYYGNMEYLVECSSPTEPSESFLTGLQQAHIDAAIATIKQDTTTAIEEYFIDSAQVVLWEYGSPSIEGMRLAYVQALDYPEFYVETEAAAFPIVPLKRNYGLVNSDKQDLLLKQIGMEGDDFSSSLATKEVRDAYLSFGISCTDTSESSVMYIYEMFAKLADIEATDKLGVQKISKNITVAFDALNIVQEYGVEAEVIPDSDRDVGTYWYTTKTVTRTKTCTDDDGHTSTTDYNVTYPQYCKQEAPDYYVEITRMYLVSTLTVGGIVKKWSSNVGVAPSCGSWGGAMAPGLKLTPLSEEVRYPLIRDIAIRLPMNNYSDVLESSMSIIVNTIVKVKVKWYQRGFFKFIMIIVIVVLSYFSFGAASALGKFLIVASAVSSIAGIMGINTGLLGDILAVIGFAYSWYTAYTTGLADMAARQVAILASQTLAMVNRVSAYYFEKDMAKAIAAVATSAGIYEEEQKEFEKETENAIEGGLNMSIKAKPVDGYYEMALGNFDQYSFMYDTPYNYDRMYV